MKSRTIAFGSIYSAISILLLTFSAIFSDDLFLLMLSSIPVAILSEKFGKRLGLLSYAVVLVVAFLIFPLRISTMGFILLFGPYAILRTFFKGKKTFQIIFHLIILFGLSAVAYSVLSYILKIDLISKYSILALSVFAIALILYERLVEYFSRWYSRVFETYFRRS
jgi:hypothetical protein